jgi:hypothetical protein
MSEDQTISPKELRLMIRLLEKLRDNANHQTMTGGLAGGEEYARQQFNAILDSLAERGMPLPPYFPPLSEDASIGAVGVAADLVAAYLREMLEPEREEDRSGGFSFDRFFGGRDFAHIGEAIRESMPDWMQRAAEERSRARAAGAASAEAAASATHAAHAAGHAAHEQARRMAELGQQMQAVAARMRAADLSPEEMQRLAAELSRLAEEQARVARGDARGAAEME